LAGRVAGGFPDGTFFVPLEPIRDPMLVTPRIAAALGIPDAGARPVFETMVEWLHDRRVLLVLDNFEQVTDAGPIVADLLRAASGLKVIATSRAALRISGEQELPVPGLPAPPDPSQLSSTDRLQLPGASRAVDPGTLGQYAAVRLFIERAVAVKPSFSVTNDNAPAVAAISARLHGMPLAIELAAARIKLLSPDAILGRLEHQLDILAAGSRDLPLPANLRATPGATTARRGHRLPIAYRSLPAAATSNREAICGRRRPRWGPADGRWPWPTRASRSRIPRTASRARLLDTIREYAAEQLTLAGKPTAFEIAIATGTWRLPNAPRGRCPATTVAG
jgi:predicted ATPase